MGNASAFSRKLDDVDLLIRGFDPGSFVCPGFDVLASLRHDPDRVLAGLAHETYAAAVNLDGFLKDVQLSRVRLAALMVAVDQYRAGAIPT